MLQGKNRMKSTGPSTYGDEPFAQLDLNFDRRIAVIVAIVWVGPSTIPYIFAATDRLDPLVSIALAAAGVLFLAISGMKPVLSRLRPGDFLFGVGVGAVFLLSTMVHPATSGLVIEISPVFFGTVLPLFFLGRSIRNFSEVIRYCYVASILAISVNGAYSLYYLSSGRVFVADNMDAAYKILPAVLLICLVALRSGGPGAWVAASFSVFLLVAQGTRGPLVCLAVFLGLYWLVHVWRSPRGLMATAAAFAGIVLFYASISESAGLFALWLERIGFSGRTILMAQRNELADSNGRDEIYGQIWEGINNRPLLGNGIGGDRLIAVGKYYEEGTYAHNFFLEVLAQFGYVAGSIAIFCSLSCIVRALFLSHGSARDFLIVLVGVCVKLLMSGSYLNEPLLFLLLGCSVSVLNSAHGARRSGRHGLGKDLRWRNERRQRNGTMDGAESSGWAKLAGKAYCDVRICLANQVLMFAGELGSGVSKVSIASSGLANIHTYPRHPARGPLHPRELSAFQRPRIRLRSAWLARPT